MDTPKDDTTTEILDRMEAFAETELEMREISYLPNPEPFEALELAEAAQHLADVETVRERLPEDQCASS